MQILHIPYKETITHVCNDIPCEYIKKDKESSNNYHFECEMSDDFFYVSGKHIFTKANTAMPRGMAIFIFPSGNSSGPGLSFFVYGEDLSSYWKIALWVCVLSHGEWTVMIGSDMSFPKNIECSSWPGVQTRKLAFENLWTHITHRKSRESCDFISLKGRQSPFSSKQIERNMLTSLERTSWNIIFIL